MNDDFIEKFGQWVMIVSVSWILLGLPTLVACFVFEKQAKAIGGFWIVGILAILLFSLVVLLIKILTDVINDDL